MEIVTNYTISKKNGKIGVKTYTQLLIFMVINIFTTYLNIYIKHASMGELNSSVHKNNYYNANTLKIHKGKR